MILESSKINITYGHQLSTIYLLGIISLIFTRERIENRLCMLDQFMSFHMMAIKQPSLQFYGKIFGSNSLNLKPKEYKRPTELSSVSSPNLSSAK